MRAAGSGLMSRERRRLRPGRADRWSATLLTSSTEEFRPTVYVALEDAAVRARVASVLENAGCVAIVEPTGFHVLRSISDLIDGARAWRRPRLIVMDAFARGCAGTTIALGLRDLGIRIPIVLACAAGQPRPAASADRLLHIAEASAVERMVREQARAITRPLTPPEATWPGSRSIDEEVRRS